MWQKCSAKCVSNIKGKVCYGIEGGTSEAALTTSTDEDDFLFMIVMFGLVRVVIVITYQDRL